MLFYKKNILETKQEILEVKRNITDIRNAIKVLQDKDKEISRSHNQRDKEI